METLTQTRTLPPLILHPFADPTGPGKLVESSRASLMQQGLLPTGDFSEADLDRAVLEGRYCELRMLYYVGKDLLRWIEQCIELAERDAHFQGRNVRPQSFAQFLIRHTPVTIQAKLRKWGVADYKAIFTRALGLNAIRKLSAPDRMSSTPVRCARFRMASVRGFPALISRFTNLSSSLSSG